MADVMDELLPQTHQGSSPKDKGKVEKRLRRAFQESQIHNAEGESNKGKTKGIDVVS